MIVEVSYRKKNGECNGGIFTLEEGTSDEEILEYLTIYAGEHFGDSRIQVKVDGKPFRIHANEN